MSYGTPKRHRRRLAKTSLHLIIVLSILAVVAFASPVTVTRAPDASFAGALIEPYFENQNAPVTGCTSPCLTVDTQTTQPGTSSSFALPSASSMYLWSPQFASATTAYAGTWALDFWASAASYSYVPVTLTNGQTSATPNPLQVKVTWSPSSYSSYEASNLGNVRFCSDTACVGMLYAWLESCSPSCTPSATSATAWVKLTSSLAANGGSITIYMVFLTQTKSFDGIYWGEAPSLSGTYGQYDNGGNVFSLYFNGDTATSSFTEDGSTLTQATGTSYGSATINALKLAVKATKSAMSFTSGIAAGAYVAETNLEINAIGDVTTDYVGLVDSGTASSLANGVGGGQDGSSHFIYNYWTSGTRTLGTASSYTIVASTWYYADVIYAGTSATSFTTDLYSTLYSTPLATATATANPLSSIGTFYFGLPTGNGGATGTTLYFNWGRVRVYPPSGVLPSVSLGSVSSDTLSVSIYVTNSAGTSTATVASNVQSPNLGTAESEYGMTFSAAQVTIPAGGYISFVITASAASCTFYWGTGQPTNFQVSYASRTT